MWITIINFFFQGAKTSRRSNLELYQRSKYLTGTADLHLCFPILLDPTIAYRTINKPAKVAGFELPGRTHLSSLHRAIFHNPARLFAFVFSLWSRDQKKHLPFYVSRHRSPALFVAVDSFKRSAQKLGDLLLGFSEFVAELFEFVAVHDETQIFSLKSNKKRLTQSSHHFTRV